MKIVSLFSGGKDSVFALKKALDSGHELCCLLTVKSKRSDSYMYHIPNIHLTELSAQAMDLPLVVVESSGEKEKELIELKNALADLKKQKGIEAVVSGAIASQYQKKRIDIICKELSLESIAPLWEKNQLELLKEMISQDFEIVVVGVAAAGLDEDWLGRKIDSSAVKELEALAEKYSVSVVGEGGEFESLVTDAPLFKKKIEVVEKEKNWSGSRGVLEVKKAVLAGKD